MLVGFELEKTYPAEEIGHFRVFCLLYLKEPRHKVFSVLFGSSDKADRMHGALPETNKGMTPGIKFGISGGQWEEEIELSENAAEQIYEEEPGKYKHVGSSSSMGMNEVKFIQIRYDKDTFVRVLPTLALRDLNEASFLPLLNLSLAEKVSCIHIFANEYKLMEIPRKELKIDRTDFTPNFPVAFSEEELRDPWVRIRPSTESAFRFSFSEQTPQRIFMPRETQNSLRKSANP